MSSRHRLLYGIREPCSPTLTNKHSPGPSVKKNKVLTAMDFGQFKIKGGTEKPAGMVKPVFGHDRMKSALTFCPSACSTSQDARASAAVAGILPLGNRGSTSSAVMILPDNIKRLFGVSPKPDPLRLLQGSGQSCDGTGPERSPSNLHREAAFEAPHFLSGREGSR